MYHHAAVRQCRALALLARNKQHGGHAGGHARADGGHVRAYKLHGIVYTEACRNASARRVDIYRYVFAVIHRVEVEQLGLQRVGGIVVNL